MKKQYWGVRNSSGGYSYSDSLEKTKLWVKRYNDGVGRVEEVTNFINEQYKTNELFHEFNDYIEV